MIMSTFWNMMFDMMDYFHCETFDNFVFWLMDIESFFRDGHLSESIDFWIYCLK